MWKILIRMPSLGIEGKDQKDPVLKLGWQLPRMPFTIR